MDIKPYERYKTDIAPEEEKKKQLENYTDFQKAVLQSLENYTAPKKPVKWFFGKDKDAKMVGLETLQNVLRPTEMAVKTFLPATDSQTGKKKPPFYNINKFIRESKGMKEKDYIDGLDEIAKGLETGQFNLTGALSSLITAPTDFVLGTDFTSALEEKMNDGSIKPDEPETWRGELTSLGVQYGIPGTLITKLIGRSNALAPAYKFLGLNKATKTSKIAKRALEWASVGAATDFIASEPDRGAITPIPFTQPSETKGLTGRKKAAAVLKNKIKYGAEGTIVGGGFPLIGKGLQLGYKYLGPKWALKHTARIGAKSIDWALFKPVSYVLSRDAAAPAVRATSNAIRGATDWTLTKMIAPTIKGHFKNRKNFPSFEEWRLGSATSADPMRRSAKKLDNWLSWLRSYGKNPKTIERAKEEVNLFARGTARKFDRAFEALDNKVYNLAKGFEGRYKGNKTSPAGEKYFFDQIDEYFKGQRELNTLPKNLQVESSQIKKELIKVMTNFRRVLPKGKQGDAVTKDVEASIRKNIGNNIVRSFRIFTNENYVPSEKVVNTASDWLRKNLVTKNKNMREQARKSYPNMGAQQAYKASADDMVKEIMITGRGDGQNPLDVLRFIAKDILQDKKYKFLKTGEELPVAIKNLLGQERNAKFSVLNTATNAITQTMAKNASDFIAKTGLREGWLFSSKEAARATYNAPQKINRIPRLGILKTELEGLYTSPEFAQMFQGLGGTLKYFVENAFFRHMLQMKTGVQIGKTLYSPVTQVRNVTSASTFALNAGHVGGKASVLDSMRIVMNDIFKAGKEKTVSNANQIISPEQFNDFIQKLTRLGVIDENIVAMELKGVLDDIKIGKLNTLDGLFDRLIKMTPTDKVARVYAGGDNLWKIYGWNFDKSQLLDAGMKSVDDVADLFKHIGEPFSKTNIATGAAKNLDDALDEMAAWMIRNSYPTYSKVPPLIQAWRRLPLGNFISFPAEIVRTSATNIALGLKLASHPNAAIRQIGIRRITGSTLTLYGLGKAVSGVAEYLTGTSESQQDAYKRSFAAPWNRIANLIPLKGWDNGENLMINFTYFMPYDVIQRPLEAALKQMENQDLNPNQVDDFILNQLFQPDGPIQEFLEPFVSEPLGFDRLIDVTLRNGNKPQGGRVYTKGDDLSDKINKSFAYVLEGVKPGVVTTFERISDGLRKDITRGGKPVNTFDELVALMSGIRLIRIDAKEDLGFYATQFNKARRDVDETDKFYTGENWATKTPSDLERIFREMQEDDLRIQKDMHIRIKDLELLGVSKMKIRQILKSKNVNPDVIDNLMRNKFTPTNYSEPRFDKKVDQVKKRLREDSEDSTAYEYFINKQWVFPRAELNNIKREYRGKRLFPDGYNPDKETYQKNKQGQTLYDTNGNPIKEKGFIEKQMEKIVPSIKKLITPGSPYESKIKTPPLPKTDMPKLAANPQQINNQTGLTRTETALLSPSEQEIARKT
jgi:hypothetical protein